MCSASRRFSSVLFPFVAGSGFARKSRAMPSAGRLHEVGLAGPRRDQLVRQPVTIFESRMNSPSGGRARNRRHPPRLRRRDLGHLPHTPSPRCSTAPTLPWSPRTARERPRKANPAASLVASPNAGH
jgi:hypothetical protein